MEDKKSRGVERGADFYDKHTRLLSIPLEESPWLPVYKAALDFMPKDKQIGIIDLGCGAGRFAELLWQKGYENYFGVDFSKELIKIAKKSVPDYRFLTEDVFNVASMFNQFDVLVFLEILEHIMGDLEILSMVPPDKTVIMSVPNYMSKTHVRAFNNVEEVVKRYGHLLRFEDYVLGLKSKKQLNHFPPGSDKPVKMYTKIFVCRCVRR